MNLHYILVISKSAEEHAEHLRLVLQLLREHEFYATGSKCLFKQPELEFLCHIVGCEAVKVDLKKKTGSENDIALQQHKSAIHSPLSCIKTLRHL